MVSVNGVRLSMDAGVCRGVSLYWDREVVRRVVLSGQSMAAEAVHCKKQVEQVCSNNILQHKATPFLLQLVMVFMPQDQVVI